MATVAKEKVYGVLAEFGSPGELLKAAKKVREGGYEKFDCHSPFPILLASSRISSSLVSGLAYRMFSAAVPENRNGV